MLKQIIALGSVITCCLGNPSNAVSNNIALSQKLNEIGVTTMIQNSCSPAKDHMAIYNSYTNVMCINEDIVNSNYLQLAIMHETVHVIQDCIAGMDNGSMGSITSFIAEGDEAKEKSLDEEIFNKLKAEGLLEHVVKVTGGLGKVGSFVEVEAYALQNRSDIVLNLLDRCQPNGAAPRLSNLLSFDIAYG